MTDNTANHDIAGENLNQLSDAFGAISELIETISARAGVSLDEACDMIRDRFLAEASAGTKGGN